MWNFYFAFFPKLTPSWKRKWGIQEQPVNESLPWAPIRNRQLIHHPAQSSGAAGPGSVRFEMHSQSLRVITAAGWSGRGIHGSSSAHLREKFDGITKKGSRQQVVNRESVAHPTRVNVARCNLPLTSPSCSYHISSMLRTDITGRH